MKELSENMILLLLSVISGFFILKTSNDIILPIFHYKISLLNQFYTGNNIIFNLSIGVFVSVIFYILIVKYPEYKRKEIIKNNLKREYDLFRFSVISKFLTYCLKDGFDNLNHQDVNSVKKFRIHFDKVVKNRNTRLDCVISELKQEDIENMLVDIEIFIENIDNFFNKVHVADDELYKFFRELKGEIYRARHSELEEGNRKIILRSIRSLLLGWDSEKGYRDYDIIEKLIDEV